MKGIYQYSLLRYTHSQFLGEEVNVGIIFYFPSEDKTVFKYPKNLIRLKHLYKDFPEKLVKSYLAAFEKSALKFAESHEFFKIRKLENILPKYFIVPDGSALAFDKVSTGVQFQSIEDTAEDLFKRYFAPYFDAKNIIDVKPHDEIYIVNNFHNLIKQKDENVVHYLRGEKKIKTTKALLRVDDHWKNGTINLVKAVSFDLQEEVSILHKAAELLGTLSLLNDELRNQNYRCDIIFAAPQDSSLKSVYNNAIDVVSSAPANTEIYLEQNIETYVNKVLDQIQRFSLEDDETPF